MWQVAPRTYLIFTQQNRVQWNLVIYNEVLGTMKMTLLYQVSHYIRVKKNIYIKSWDQQNYLVIRGFCYIRPLYNEVPLYRNGIGNQHQLHPWSPCQTHSSWMLVFNAEILHKICPLHVPNTLTYTCNCPMPMFASWDLNCTTFWYI